MKSSNLLIISFIFLAGINNQIIAQTARKVETKIEPKEINPVKEAEVRELPHAETVAQPMQHTEIIPVKEPEIRQETQPEVAPTYVPVEEPKTELAPEKAEWVKTTPEPVKITSAPKKNAVLNATPLSKMPVYRGQAKPMVKSATIKPFVLDTTKKP